MALSPHDLVLYSAQTWLAYAIAYTYYDDEHYVWCTPYFNGQTKQALVPGANPPSSTPGTIVRTLRADIAQGDRHSDRIEANRSGLRRGAQVKHEAGVISNQQVDDIGAIIDGAQLNDFKPVVFVIPVAGVAGMVADVPIEDKAHPLSEEYIVPNLPGSAFDMIEIE